MMTTITREQAEALAALVHALRPAWGVPGIVKALSDARTLGGPYEVAHAALYAAQDPKVQKPAVIALPGEHWTRGKPLGQSGVNRVRCDVDGHRSYWADNCGACRADQRAVEGEPTHQAPRTPRVPPERIAEILATATPEPDHHPHDDARTRAAGKD